MNLFEHALSFGKRALYLVLLLFSLLIVPSAEAHYCGPPVIRCRPGDIVTYYIVSDRAEEGVSGYSVFDQTNPSVAPVTYYTPVGRIFGMFVISPQQVGTNVISLYWTFPGNGASGFCVVEVRVTNSGTTTAGNNPWSTFVGDPVNAYTGELVVDEPPDLFLGGPMPLCFSRYYASRLQADTLVNSRLGNNWSHNFEWRALLLTNEAAVISPKGMVVRFNKSGTNWVLQSPAYLPFQLVTTATNTIFGNPRDNRLYTFGTNGFLTSISDGKGNTHTLTYTEDLLTQVSDGLGRTLTFDYVGAQQLSRVSDGTRSVGFQQLHVGSDFNLIQVTNTLGKTTTHTYDNSKNVKSLLTGTTYPAGNAGYAQVYDSEGRVVQQTRGTNTTYLAYNTNTFTTYVTNALGHVSSYGHSSDGHLLSLSDPGGESLLLSTNAQGRRASVMDRTGATFGMAYDPASGRPSFITNADGTVTSFTYTNRTVNGIVLYDLASATMPDGSIERFTYDAKGNLTAVEDRAGKFSRMGYNSRGQVTSVTNALGGVVSMTYNADGTLATHTDPEIGAITFGHDSLRRATNAVAVDGRMMRLAFDLGDRITSITDERTNTTYFGFDFNDRLVSVTNALGQVNRFNYDALDRVTNITDRLGRNLSFGFDGLNQVVAITNRNGNRVQVNWDPKQRVSGVVDAANKLWSLGYNDEDAVTSFTNPVGSTTTVERDEAGFVSAVTNALSQTTRLERDAMHRVTAMINPLSRYDQLSYDARGSLTNTAFSAVGWASSQFNDLGLPTKITDHRGNQWLFNHSSLGRLTNSVDPLNRTNRIIYDSRGRPSRFIFADGSTQTNSYDAAGNLSTLDFSGAVSSTFAYDALNRMTNTGSLGLFYDAEDRVTNTVSSSINFGAAYDAGGRLTNVTYNGGLFSVAYSYDSRDRLTRVRDTLTSAQVDFYYDDAGRLTNVVRANGVNGIYDYDAAGHMTRIREGGFLDLKYTFDGAGQITSIDSTAPLSAAPSTPQTNNLSFDSAQQINTAGYSYDARGRLTNGPGGAYTWNTASRLVSAGNVTNAYNGAGNLLARTVSTTAIRYYYNHAIYRTPIMAEQNTGTSQFVRYYIWAPGGQLLYMINAAGGNAVSYYHFDITGSTLALTSAAGAVTDAYSYTPYGVQVARTGTNPQPFTYVGRYGVRWDPAAGLYQMRARYYDPASARFLSRDPLWPRFYDPLSLNPYGYAANNPLQYIDPTGTRPELDAVMPVTTIDREQLGASSSSSIGEVLRGISPGTIPSSSGSSLNFNLGGSRTLVLIDGRRFPDGIGSGVDLNNIPASSIERVEVLRDGASAIYGSDAISGVVNIITKKADTEFDYLNLNIGYRYEPKLNLDLSYSTAEPPPAPPPPQPTRVNAQIMMFQLVPEMMIMAGYGAAVQRAPGARDGSRAYNLVQALLLYSAVPHVLPPRGTAFVNGQFVQTKPMDLVYGAYLLDDLYDELDYYDVSPADVYREFLESLYMGGSGGIYADMKGYRARAIPPVY